MSSRTPAEQSLPRPHALAAEGLSYVGARAEDYLAHPGLWNLPSPWSPTLRPHSPHPILTRSAGLLSLSSQNCKGLCLQRRKTLSSRVRLGEGEGARKPRCGAPGPAEKALTNCPVFSELPPTKASAAPITSSQPSMWGSQRSNPSHSEIPATFLETSKVILS